MESEEADLAWMLSVSMVGWQVRTGVLKNEPRGCTRFDEWHRNVPAWYLKAETDERRPGVLLNVLVSWAVERRKVAEMTRPSPSIYQH
jgi:hypothetical protein